MNTIPRNLFFRSCSESLTTHKKTFLIEVVMARDNDYIFKGVWIPAHIWLDHSLTWIQKLFLTEIDALDNEHDGCYAGNKFFAEFFDLTTGRCSQIISELEQKKYVRIKYEYQGNEIKCRRIYVVKKLTTSLEHAKEISISDHKKGSSKEEPEDDAEASPVPQFKRDDRKAGFKFKDSAYINAWNAHPEFRKHDNYRTKVYQAGHRYCMYLRQGALHRCDVDKQFLTRQKIPIDWLHRKWTDDEIHEAFDRFALMFKEEYWPADKKILPRNLSDFICNRMSGTSYFLWVMSEKPRSLADKVEVVVDTCPEVTEIYRAMFKKFHNKKITSERDDRKLIRNVNAIGIRYVALKPVLDISPGTANNYLGSLEKFARTHSEWMKRRYEDKITVSDITRSWNYFIEHVRSFYKINLEPTPEEFARMKADYDLKRRHFEAEDKRRKASA